MRRRTGNRATGSGSSAVKLSEQGIATTAPPPAIGKRDGPHLKTAGPRQVAQGIPRSVLGDSSPIRWGARTSMPMYCPTARQALMSASSDRFDDRCRPSCWRPRPSRDETESKSAASWAIDRWNSAQRVEVLLAARSPRQNRGRHGGSRRVRPRDHPCESWSWCRRR